MSAPLAAPAPPRRVPASLIVLLGLLAVLGPLTIDLYLPAFPQMQRSLATSPAQIQLTLTAATIGFALGQLVVGPWSDSVGRRLPLLVATAAHILASAAIVVVPDVTWVVVLRVVQGMGAAGGGVVATAMIRDVAEGRHLVRGFARIALFTGIAPIVAPFLGAQLMSLTSWRGIFAVVAVYGAVVAVACLILLPETLPVARRHLRSSARTVVASYRTLLGDRSFVGVGLIGGLLVSSVFAYLSSSSFVLQQEFGLTPQAYGALSAVNAVAFVVGTQVAALLAERTSPVVVLRGVVPLLAACGLALSVVSMLATDVVAVSAVMLVFFVLAGACGPCLGAIGLARHADRAGTAAALLGAANYGMAGLASPIVGALGLTSLLPLGLVIAVAMSIAVVALLTLVAPRSPRPRAG